MRNKGIPTKRGIQIQVTVQMFLMNQNPCENNHNSLNTGMANFLLSSVRKDCDCKLKHCKAERTWFITVESSFSFGSQVQIANFYKIMIRSSKGLEYSKKQTREIQQSYHLPVEDISRRIKFDCSNYKERNQGKDLAFLFLSQISRQVSQYIYSRSHPGQARSPGSGRVWPVFSLHRSFVLP